MNSKPDENALVDEETPDTATAEAQPPVEKQDESTGADESQYVTREEYQALLEENRKNNELIRRVQGQSASEIAGIRKEIAAKTQSAIAGYRMVKGEEPSPDEIATIQAKARDEVLMASDEAAPQGQPPAQDPSQADYRSDPYFIAANEIAATVEGGLSEKDPEFKMIDYKAERKSQWLASVTKATEAKRERLASQKARSPENVTTVTRGVRQTSGSYDETVNPMDLLELGHKQKRK